MIKFIIDTLKFCKENNLRGDSIDIALGKNKAPESFKEIKKHIIRNHGR